MNSILLKGVSIIEKRADLIWLKNVDSGVEEYFRRENFQIIIIQSFDGEQIKKIMHCLDDQDKLIIDFDKHTVKIIKQKEKPFEEVFRAFFDKKTIENEFFNMTDSVF